MDKNYPWTVILDAAAFVIHLTTSRQKGYSLGQLIFDRDVIIPKKHRVDWELIRKQKQTKINRDNACKNKHTVDYDYKVGDKVILLNHTAYKYETPYSGTFLITKCFTNGTVMLQYGTVQMTYNIRCIKPYKSDTKFEYFNPKNIDDTVNVQRDIHILLYEAKAWNKVYDQIHTGTLTLIHIIRVSEVFMEKYFLHNS